MDQHFPSVGGPWASSVLGEEERKGRREEGEGQVLCTNGMKWAWFEAGPQIWMGLEIPGDLSADWAEPEESRVAGADVTNHSPGRVCYQSVITLGAARVTNTGSPHGSSSGRLSKLVFGYRWFI